MYKLLLLNIDFIYVHIREYTLLLQIFDIQYAANCKQHYKLLSYNFYVAQTIIPLKVEHGRDYFLIMVKILHRVIMDHQGKKNLLLSCFLGHGHFKLYTIFLLCHAMGCID